MTQFNDLDELKNKIIEADSCAAVPEVQQVINTIRGLATEKAARLGSAFPAGVDVNVWLAERSRNVAKSYEIDVGQFTIGFTVSNRKTGATVPNFFELF